MRRIILDTHIFLWLIFDRLIICQSLQYDLNIMTEDGAILNYPQLNLYPTTQRQSNLYQTARIFMVRKRP